MTLDEKRQVIELLLCADHRNNLSMVDQFIGFRSCDPLRIAIDLRWKARGEFLGIVSDDVMYVASCVEAAYRLIETSATLRAEWFT
jgi:hypothetical protein